MDSLAMLNRVSEALNLATEPEHALREALRSVAELLGMQVGWIWLADGDRFYLAASHGLPPSLQEPVRMTGRWCRCLDAFRKGELDVTRIGVVECTRLAQAVEDGGDVQGLAYHVSIPLKSAERPLGVMNIAGPRRELADWEMKVLSSVAHQVGLALERIRLATEERRLVREQERTRLAREIHDHLAQSLTAVALQLESAQVSLEQAPKRAGARLERALSIVRDGLEQARRAMAVLRDTPLHGRSLPEALRAEGQAFTSRTGVPVTIRGRVGKLEHEAEAELFMIVREALTNVERHAGARQVRVSLERDQAELCVRVEDDGRGLPEEPALEGRYGLLGMQERARLLGGELVAAPRPQGGTRVEVRIPL